MYFEVYFELYYYYVNSCYELMLKKIRHCKSTTILTWISVDMFVCLVMSNCPTHMCRLFFFFCRALQLELESFYLLTPRHSSTPPSKLPSHFHSRNISISPQPTSQSSPGTSCWTFIVKEGGICTRFIFLFLHFLLKFSEIQFCFVLVVKQANLATSALVIFT